MSEATVAVLSEVSDDMEQQQTQVQELETQLDRERTRLLLVDRTIDQISDRVRRGDASRANELTKLANQKAAITQAIVCDTRRLETERGKLAILSARQKRREFDALIEEGTTIAESFVANFQLTELLLGSFCDRLHRARLITNSLITIAGADPVLRARIAQLESLVDNPRKGATSVPVLSSGWDLKFQVTPRRER